MIYRNVKLGKNVFLEEPVIIGKPPRGKKDGELETVIGDNATIRAFTVIYAGTVIGKNFQTGHGTVIREDNVIGDNCSIGSHTVVENGNRIGDGTRLHTACVLESVTLGDNLFIGPNVVFSADLHPPCPRYKECVGGPVVRNNSKIGANSTIMPGVEIGENCLIGAGSVVVGSIPKDSLAYGNPARVLLKVSDLKCVKGFFKRPYEWEAKGV